MQNVKAYSISEVIELTGATEFLLRTWELRYKLVQPQRTPTGRRLYNSYEVMKISKVVSLLNQGHKISKLAQCDLADLNRIDGQMTEKLLPADNESVKNVYKHLAKTHWIQVKDIFEEQRKKMKPLDYISNFIIPLGQEMAQRSLEERIDIVQEHILSSLIKENIYALPKPTVIKDTKILFATLEGDHHDLGLLISKVIAEQQGAQCIYLGSHVPKKELAEACIRLRPNCLVIGTSINLKNTAKDHLFKYVHFIDRHIPQSIHMWVGGNASQNLVVSLRRPFKIFKDINKYSAQINQLLKNK